ncbi:MAG: DUF5994 family protein, partial [Actinopolymorphaceae bacterium]
MGHLLRSSAEFYFRECWFSEVLPRSVVLSVQFSSDPWPWATPAPGSSPARKGWAGVTFIHGGHKHGGHRSAPPPPEPPTPRVQWGPTLSRRAPVQGAWWPRSIDPYAELPGLILAVDDRLLSVTSVVLGIHGWESRPRQVRVADRTIRLNWFTTQPDALVTVMCGERNRVDLLVIPSATSPGVAEAAMDLAIQA